MTATRADVVAFARSLAGLGACPHNPAARARYLELIARGETPERAAQLAAMYGCELTCLGILDHFIKHRLIEDPYVGGHAGENLLAVGREAGAATPGLSRWPEDGDMLIVGGGPALGGPEHAWTSLSSTVSPYEHAPADAVEQHEGLDGGQLDAEGKQQIHLRQHELRAGRDRTESYDREVQWVINIALVIDRFGRPVAA